MTLQFTNKQIYFALESIWNRLDYRFKFHINQLVLANSDDDFVQNVEVDVPILIQCYEAMSTGSYGCTVDMAEELLDSLRTQLLAEANINDYLTYLALEDKTGVDEVIPNEQTLALLQIQDYKNKDLQTRDLKIINGKPQILA